MARQIFITGGTGYIGSRLINKLLLKNYQVKALVRKGSENKIPPGCEAVIGSALDPTTFENKIVPATTFIHLVGVAHPSPRKKQQFIDIDLASIQRSVKAAKDRGLEHFIYISVAQPNEIMKEYTEVRKKGEAMIRENSETPHLSGHSMSSARDITGHFYLHLFSLYYHFQKVVRKKQKDSDWFGLGRW
jgi:nucleoside-diphosphate-sugar epimerase